MPDKLDQTIRVIISKPEEIVEVCGNDYEYFFRFRNYAMSITERTTFQPMGNANIGPGGPIYGYGTGDLTSYGRFVIYIYPGYTGSLTELLRNSSLKPAEVLRNSVSYRSCREDEEVFRQLFNTCKGKKLNIDKMFDDIIDGSNK